MLTPPPLPRPLAVVPPPTSSAVPVVPSGTVLEQQAMKVVLEYFALWSQTTTNIDGLGCSFILRQWITMDVMTPRSKVMDEKLKFSIRWPLRNYSIRPGSISAQCVDTCTVSAVVEWDTKSYERNDHSVGSANIYLRIVLNASPTGGAILSENELGPPRFIKNPSSRLTGAAQPSYQSLAPPASEPLSAATGPSYYEGRQARIDYEQMVRSTGRRRVAS